MLIIWNGVPLLKTINMRPKEGMQDFDLHLKIIEQYVPGCECCYFSIAQAGREMNISCSHLYAMLLGKRSNTIGIEYV